MKRILVGMALMSWVCSCAHAAPGTNAVNPLVTAGDVAGYDRSIDRGTWRLDLYRSGARYIRMSNEVCRVPDAAYLDVLHVPCETDVLPMAGANTKILKQTPEENNRIRVEWHEDAAFHGDYRSGARDGWYVLDGDGRVIQASISGKTLSYSYDLPVEPSNAPSCYVLKLPYKYGKSKP